MIEKLDFLVRFWQLQGRHATLGEPLDQREQTELLSLMHLVSADVKPPFGAEPRMPAQGPAARVANALPAQMIGAGAAIAVEIRAVTAAALVVTGASALPVDASVIVRATDAVTGVEYVLPCKVAWTHPGSPVTIALAIDGIPARTTFDAGEGPRARASLTGYQRLFGWSAPDRGALARRQ